MPILSSGLTSGKKSLLIGGLWLLVILAFFVEYRRPLSWVFIPYDLDGYHLPLLDGAFQSFRQGEVPLWDENTYNGIPLLANGQAALWYPPTWLLFAANIGKKNFAYGSLKDFLILHVWVTCWFSFLWLRQRTGSWLAGAAGAVVMGCSGYMMTQLQHMGLVCGFAWFPIGMWGVEQSRQSGSWRPLWKTALASAMIFLAGYVPLWPVFAMCGLCFGIPGPWRTGLQFAGRYLAALLLSLAVCAVQILPMLEASSWMTKDARFGAGIRDWKFYATFVFPNFHLYGMDQPVGKDWGMDYWYIGGIGLLGVALGLWAWVRSGFPADSAVGRTLVLLLALSIVLTDPAEFLSSNLEKTPLLDMLIRNWYFLAGVTVVVARLTAEGFASAPFRSQAKNVPGWALVAPIVFAALWASYLVVLWLPGGAEFAPGFAGAVYPVVTGSTVFLLLWVSTQHTGKKQWIAGLAMLAVAIVELKALGTSRRFNAGLGSQPDVFYSTKEITGLDPKHFTELLANRHFRIAFDETGPNAAQLRRTRLTTSSGFDPLFPKHLREYAELHGKMTSDRTFELNLLDQEVMREMGVGFVLVSDSSPYFPKLVEQPDRFEHLLPHTSYYKVFRIKDAEPTYYLATANAKSPNEQLADSSIKPVNWRPQTREFAVRSPNGASRATLHLKTNSYPGWQAQIDGNFVALKECGKLEICVDVPPGEHTVKFRYLPASLLTGLALSLISITVALWLFRRQSN